MEVFQQLFKPAVEIKDVAALQAAEIFGELAGDGGFEPEPELFFGFSEVIIFEET